MVRGALLQVMDRARDCRWIGWLRGVRAGLPPWSRACHARSLLISALQASRGLA